jgi:membrane protein YdbS with pleckstrin-like domain
MFTLSRCIMVESDTHFPLNQPSRPAPSLVTWLSVNFIQGFLILMSFTVMPVLLTVGPDTLVLAILAVIVIVPVIVFFVWVVLYYKSIWYELREDEMSWKRGVWFRTTGIVPYNRITNLDVKQGPVMRFWGSRSLRSRQPVIPARQCRRSGLKAWNMPRSSAN